MKVHASKSSRWNQSPKTSKMASRRSFGSGPPAPRLGDDQVHRPDLVAERQEGQNQCILGREVAVKSGFSHAGPFDQLIDSDVADTAVGEQLVGSGQYPVHGFAMAGTHLVRQQGIPGCIRSTH